MDVVFQRLHTKNAIVGVGEAVPFGSGALGDSSIGLLQTMQTLKMVNLELSEFEETQVSLDPRCIEWTYVTGITNPSPLWLCSSSSQPLNKMNLPLIIPLTDAGWTSGTGLDVPYATDGDRAFDCVLTRPLSYFACLL